MDENPPESEVTKENVDFTLYPVGALSLHLASGLGLASAFWISHNLYSLDLISNPAKTLQLTWLVECPIVILLYSLLRQNPSQCSYMKAVGRGMLGLPVGALILALGAIALGSPVRTKYLLSTTNWSLLMSLFTVTPAACVFGSSWEDWQRLFAHIRPKGSIDYSLCFPALGAVIGAWFGAWPMPLDWERPWQEWPICVTYGAMAGYVFGMVTSCGFVLFSKDQHVKTE